MLRCCKDCHGPVFHTSEFGPSVLDAAVAGKEPAMIRKVIECVRNTNDEVIQELPERIVFACFACVAE